MRRATKGFVNSFTAMPDPRGQLLAETARTWGPQPNRLRAPFTIGFLPAKFQLSRDGRRFFFAGLDRTCVLERGQ